MTAPKLHLGTKLHLPVQAVTRSVAIVGQKGTGKTSTAVVLTEEAAEVGARFAVMDPTGAWWGLRSSADGEGPGLECIVMGGFNGDVPLDPGAGAVVARLVVEEGYSVVCDLERMPWSEKIGFVGDFAATAFELCRVAVTIVVDEAHRFIGQSTGTAGLEKEERDSASRCRQALRDVGLLGRRKGLGSVWVTQRPANLHKDALEQSDVLISHRMMGVNDRKAIGGWLEEYGEGEDWLERLPKIKSQHAVVLAPEYDVGGVFPIRAKRTFDSSATPEVGAVLLDAPVARSDIDLSALEAKMGHALEEALENDPEALKRKIARLEEQLAAGGGADQAELEAVEDALREAQEELDHMRERVLELETVMRAGLAVADGLRSIEPVVDELTARLAEVGMHFTTADRAPGSAPAGEKGVQTVAAPTRPAAGDGARESESNGGRRAPLSPSAGSGNAAGPGSAGEQPGPPSSDGPAIKAGAKRMVGALLRAPRPLDRGELGTLADVRKGGTMSDYLSALRAHGWIDDAAGAVELTPVGRREARRMFPGVEGVGLSPEQIIEPHGRKVKAGARRMLDHLMRAHPEGYTRGELSRLADVSKGGTFSDYLSSLKVRGLAEERAKRVYAGQILYLWRSE